MNSLFLWSFCVNVLIHTNVCIPLGMFYPYGSSYGDSKLHKNDDGSSDEIYITTAFPFFNHSERALFVNTNGDLTFISALASYTPESFPFQQNARIIAPYWADVDTRTVGDIWYRETNSILLLGRASSDIRTTFPQQSTFNASWMFITTWDRVGFYGADPLGQTKRCTFQCILVTDGRYSFVIFNYNLIQWTTGTTGGGSSSSGLGGTPAQVLLLKIRLMEARRGSWSNSNDAHFDNTCLFSTPAKYPTKVITYIMVSEILLLSDFRTALRRQLRRQFISMLDLMLVLDCFGNPCQHGTCLSLEHTFMCLCDLGYEGLHCQINTNDCVTEPCLYGYCVDKVNDFVCECGMLFNGKRCTKLKTWAIITTTVSSVVLYVMSCCCCVFLCKQKNSDSKAKSSVIPHKQKSSPRGKPVPSKAGKRNAWVV
ncbi:Hypothetical predicted protein [Mytilus galloprovincialis]|uniref:Sushi, nidogen and EGF-like domain-containing protein 1 n=1 Tax=Mytilus galloprovincialis TaxID=29158 RepID=A0A8B6CKX0_MYTGA|nr:Hypothetical predicted protein [Mytilus galloprovincialis]